MNTNGRRGLGLRIRGVFECKSGIFHGGEAGTRGISKSKKKRKERKVKKEKKRMKRKGKGIRREEERKGRLQSEKEIRQKKEWRTCSKIWRNKVSKSFNFLKESKLKSN